MASFESDFITDTTTNFAEWEAEEIFLEQGGKAEDPTLLALAILDMKGSIPAPVGATLHLNASAEGGRAKECLFFRRLEHNRFDVIQPWSDDMSAAWHIETNEQCPSVAEILLAVRNVEHLPWGRNDYAQKRYTCGSVRLLIEQKEALHKGCGHSTKLNS